MDPGRGAVPKLRLRLPHRGTGSTPTRGQGPPPACLAGVLLPSIFPSIRVFFSQFFASDGQSIGVSASASVLPINIED